MKIKLGKRSYTFVIIPDANNKVRRFRLSAVVLTAIPSSVVMVLCLAVTMYIFSQHTVEQNRQITDKLAEQTALYEVTVTENMHTIEELESNIIELSRQTELMKLKMSELEQLEEELLDISGNEVSSAQNGSAVQAAGSADRPVSISSWHNDLSGEQSEQVGGPTVSVSRADISSLIDSTRSSLSEMDASYVSLVSNLERTKEHMLEQLELLRITPTLWPTESDKITSRFGYRKDPFSRRLAMHSGLDIGGKAGDDVFAAADGVVSSAEYDRAYGYNVVIKHASGLSTRYAHLRKYTVKSGQLVAQGDTIGLLGSTGKSTGPHLHFEVIKNGKAVDPESYLLSR